MKLATCFSLLLASANFAAAADRVALVIGNGAYQNAVKLPNPPRDAKSMADLLRALKFDVIEGEDLDKAALDAKLREFSKAAETAKATFVFYAGHGMQVDGKNYLIPIDAKLSDRSALDFEVTPVDRVIKYAKRDNGVAIVLLDACRDNPLSRRFVRSFVASRSGAPPGLATPSVVGGGVIIGFATAPGEEASDGAGDHSPFTTALLKELPKPGVDIQMALTHVSGDVKTATHGQQVPWRSSDLQSDFYLNGAPAGTTGPAAADLAGKAWASIQKTTSTAVLESFIQTFGNTVYGKMAQARIKELEKKKIAMIPPQTPPSNLPDRKPITISLDANLRIDQTRLRTPGRNAPRGFKKSTKEEAHFNSESDERKAFAITLGDGRVLVDFGPHKPGTYVIECGLGSLNSRSDYPRVHLGSGGSKAVHLKCKYEKVGNIYDIRFGILLDQSRTTTGDPVPAYSKTDYSVKAALLDGNKCDISKFVRDGESSFGDPEFIREVDKIHTTMISNECFIIRH